MSISWFAPAATTFGWWALTATAGSFCLFSANGVVGLPFVTRTSPLAALTGMVGITNTAAIAARSNRDMRLIQGPPFWPIGQGLGGNGRALKLQMHRRSVKRNKRTVPPPKALVRDRHEGRTATGSPTATAPGSITSA